MVGCTLIHICKQFLTSEIEFADGISELIRDTARIVSNDIFNGIIHYKCVLVSGAPSRCHCLNKLDLISINLQCVTIFRPRDMSSR